MDRNNNIYIKIGFGISALCVILGAFAAHLLKEFLDPADVITFETGTKYMFYHSLAISMIAMNHRKFHQNILDLSIFLFLAGMIFFTGSLYLLATRTIWGDESDLWIGAITPLGGVLFISAWCVLIFKGFIKDETNKTTSNNNKKSKGRKHSSRRLKNEVEENIDSVFNEDLAN
jgi:uncharacterized membrane protein YgdD (TMEM256/DUF423 family)